MSLTAAWPGNVNLLSISLALARHAVQKMALMQSCCQACSATSISIVISAPPCSTSWKCAEQNSLQVQALEVDMVRCGCCCCHQFERVALPRP
ncbi:hypothetical protein V8C86DRAFT_369448 [Haematococcus lacustris]